MLFNKNKKRLETIKKSVFNNEFDFYNKDLKYKEYKELFTYLNEKKELNINKNLVFISYRTLIEMVLFGVFFPFGIFLVFKGVGFTTLNHPNLIAFFTTVVFSFLAYRYLTFIGFKEIFNRKINEEDKLLLLNYMKNKYLIQEKDILLKDTVIDTSVVNNKPKDNFNSKRL